MPALKQMALIANIRRIFPLLVMISFLTINARAQFGIINTIAGNGTVGYTGDGGPALGATLHSPLGLWVDAAGNVYIADESNHAIRKITAATGIISTIAGNGTPGYTGDGGPAITAQLYFPSGICLDGAGNLYIGDLGNNVVRMVTPAGIISTVAGTGTAGFSGDGTMATSAELNGPYGVWVDASGNLLITDEGNFRVREVYAATGIINTIAGTGVGSFCCDGSPATAASFSNPSGICEDAGGTIYFSTEAGDARVRKIDPGGIIHTEMGTGSTVFGGDCGPATDAQIERPQGLALDAAGNVYLASSQHNRVREVVSATGIIHTAAGDGLMPFSGDGGPPLSAGMYPFGVFIDGAGNMYISDTNDNRVREVVVGLHDDTFTVCHGDSVVLGSSETLADSLRWSTGATTTSITVYAPGVYTLKMYVCTYVVTDTFVVKSCITVTNNGPLCPGDTLKLEAAGDSTGVSYLWTGPAGFTSTLQNPVRPLIAAADSGNYYLTVTYSGISSNDTTDVVVKPLPVVTAGSNSPICSGTGDTVMLTSTPDSTGETFVWTGPNGFSSTLQNPFVAAPPVLDQGLYKVVTTLNACLDSGTVLVFVDSTPVVPAIGSNAPICSQRDTLIFTSSDATAGVTFSWSGPNGFSSALQNPFILPDAHVPATGTYTVTATLITDDFACTAWDSMTAVVDSTPYLPALGSNSPVCSGNPLLLTATSTTGSNFSWTGPNAFTSALQNPAIAPAATIASGTYTASAYIIYPGIPGGCISDTATIYAVVDSTPATPVAGSNSPGAPGPSQCQGDTLKLTVTDATAGVNYSWAGPYGFTTTDENPIIPNVGTAATGSYTVTVALGGCSVDAITAVVITPTPPLTATNNGPVCTGLPDTLQLQAASNPGATYNWAGPYTFSSLNQNPYRTPVIYEYSGVYQVTAFLNGCPSATVNDTVIIRQTPAPPIVAWLTYCQSYPAPPLQAMGDSILWYAGTAATDTGTLVAPVPLTSNIGTAWYYTSQTLMGCTSNIDSIKVVVNPKPVVTVSNDTAVCPHDSLTLTALDSDPIAYYYWAPSMYLNNTSSASVTVNPETDMVYTVVATNQFNCTDTAHVAVNVFAGAVLDLGDSVTLYPGQTYQLNPLTNCTVFSWFPPAGLSAANISDPVASPEISTNYIVTAETSWGCSITDSVTIYVNTGSILALPNAFTPGNEGPNNQFTIIKNGEAVLNYFRIFDRWGVMVFETTNIDAGWDGTYKGTPQPFGVYVYEVSATTSTGVVFEKHGNVTLLR